LAGSRRHLPRRVWVPFQFEERLPVDAPPSLARGLGIDGLPEHAPEAAPTGVVGDPAVFFAGALGRGGRAPSTPGRFSWQRGVGPDPDAGSGRCGSPWEPERGRRAGRKGVASAWPVSILDNRLTGQLNWVPMPKYPLGRFGQRHYARCATL